MDFFNIPHQSGEFDFSFTYPKPYCHVNSNLEPAAIHGEKTATTSWQAYA